LAKRHEEPNEVTEMWREVRHERQAERADARATWTAAIEALRALGWDVERITEYQFRVNKTLDLYPTRRRFHHIPTGRRGFYRQPLEIVYRFLSKRVR